MAKREELKVEKRAVVGKRVKKLRREGILPANIYGKEFKSTSVQVPVKDFLKVFSEVNETGLVDLDYDSQTLPVLIHNVQIDPRTQTPVHADFFKVNLKEKITARVPVVAVGEAKAVVDKIGLLEQPVAELEVEALPTDLPEKIEVNVEALNAVEAEAAAAAAEAKEEAVPAEGEAPAEGEVPAEGEAPAAEAAPTEATAEGAAKGEPVEAKPAAEEAPSSNS